VRRMTCPVCQRKGIRYKKWRLALVLAVHAVKENGTLTLGVLYGATWMHGRCCRSAVDFGIEAMKQETVILAAFFTTIDQCAIHYAIDAVKARLTGRGRK